MCGWPPCCIGQLADALGGHEAKIGEMAAERVDKHGPVLEQELARVAPSSVSLVRVYADTLWRIDEREPSIPSSPKRRKALSGIVSDAGAC